MWGMFIVYADYKLNICSSNNNEWLLLEVRSFGLNLILIYKYHTTVHPPIQMFVVNINISVQSISDQMYIATPWPPEV